MVASPPSHDDGLGARVLAAVVLVGAIAVIYLAVTPTSAQPEQAINNLQALGRESAPGADVLVSREDLGRFMGWVLRFAKDALLLRGAAIALGGVSGCLAVMVMFRRPRIDGGSA